MCDKCKNYKNVCLACGNVNGYNSIMDGVEPFVCKRADLVKLVGTSDSKNFVWILVNGDEAKQVGVGTLKQLYNRTKPNANYVRFKYAIIYYSSNFEHRNTIGTLLVGLLGEVINKRAWPNKRFLRYSDLEVSAKANVSKEYVLKYIKPSFVINETRYWDLYMIKDLELIRRR